MPLAGCHAALDGGLPGSCQDHPFLETLCTSHYVVIKVSLSPNTLLGPGGQGLLPLLPCVRLRKACRATLRPARPQRKSKIETGPFQTRAVPDSGGVAGSQRDSPSPVTQNRK